MYLSESRQANVVGGIRISVNDVALLHPISPVNGLERANRFPRGETSNKKANPKANPAPCIILE
jgi:hypothetical protein